MLENEEYTLFNIARFAGSYSEDVAEETIYHIWKTAFPCDKCPCLMTCKYLREENPEISCYNVVKSVFEKYGDLDV